MGISSLFSQKRNVKSRIMPLVNYTEILDTLREFTSRERINFLPLAPEQPILFFWPAGLSLSGGNQETFVTI